jgi:hypothetical protein
VRAGTRGPERFAALASRPDLEPDALVAFARAQQLMPWLGFCVDGPRALEVLPAETVELFRVAREENEARAGRLAVRSQEIGDAFEGESIDLLFLKGLTHGACLYAHPAMRYQADIDLLVPRRDVRRAIEALAKLGYDTSTDAATGQPLADRVAEMLGDVKGKLRNACTLARGEREKVDLHWCIRTYYEPIVPAAALWQDARSVQAGGVTLRALSPEKLLLVLLCNIAADLRKARLRAKLFLDLDLAVRAMNAPGAWRGFLERRATEGSESLAVNVLALFVSLWQCGDEQPELRDELRARARRIATGSAREALALVTRPRDDPRNRRWHARVHPVSGAERVLGALRDPGTALARRLRPRRGEALLDPL